MRGGEGLNAGLNQAVDFIFYVNHNDRDNEILTARNFAVAEPPNNLALLGTFASSGSKNGNEQSQQIKDGIAKYKDTKDDGDLEKLNQANALILLKKILTEYGIDISTVEYILTEENIEPVDDKFHTVERDIRLPRCRLDNPDCEIKTQLFKIKVDKNDKILFENNKLKWIGWYSSKIFGKPSGIPPDIYRGGHYKILHEIQEEKLKKNEKEGIPYEDRNGIFYVPYKKPDEEGRIRYGGKSRTRRRRKQKKSKKGRKTRKGKSRKHKKTKKHY